MYSPSKVPPLLSLWLPASLDHVPSIEQDKPPFSIRPLQLTSTSRPSSARRGARTNQMSGQKNAFPRESTRVDIISILIGNDITETVIKKLTTGGGNKAFPSPSPDGKWVVFRSGRSGHKNLYIVDSVKGESAGLYRLTEGPWTDTMCNWSPDGEWIAFVSDRDNPGAGSFAIYMMHPNGTDLRRVVVWYIVGMEGEPTTQSLVPIQES